MSASNQIKDLRQYMAPAKHRSTFDVPTSGQIAMSDIREVMGLSGQVSLRDMADLAGLPAGKVSLSDFYGYTPCDDLNYDITVGNSGFYVGYSDGSDYTVGTFGRISCNSIAGKTIEAIVVFEDSPDNFIAGFIDLSAELGPATNLLLTPTSGSEVSPWTFVRDSGGTGRFFLSGGDFAIQRFGDWLNEDIKRTFKLEAL